MPHGLDYTAAAAMPHAAQAAWAALVEVGGLESGQTVLVHGAAGGVGGYAVQIAKQRGAHVVATASAANHDYVRGLGADEVIDYTATPFEEVVHDVDLVLDTIGDDVQTRSWQVLKPGGLLVSLISPPSEDAAAAHNARGAMAAGYPSGPRLQQIADLVAAGHLRPTVGVVLPLADVAQAHAQIETRHTRGKIMLQMNGD
jgi:NADPH:quinone reductase-like Zn-dependent oxidoreductase